MNVGESTLRKLGSVALVVIVASSLWLALRFGHSPPMRLGILLVGLALWYVILTWAKEALNK